MTPAEPQTAEDRLRAVLHAVAAGVHPRNALADIRRRTKKNAAPVVETEAAPKQAVTTRRTTAMSSISKKARSLRPGDVITRHPDHPEREVSYLVTRWPVRSADGVIVDYSAPADAPAEHRATGVLALGVDQDVQVIPTTATGTGAA